MHKIVNRWGHEHYIKVEWNIGKRCNYDCAYCPKEIHDNYSPHTDIDILCKTVNKLASLPKPVRLSLTGGEPCVHPKIEQLIEHINSKGMFLSITTNGTRKPLWYRQQPVNQYVSPIILEV